MERFNKCFEFIKRLEGGYNCINGDTGGQTIFGIAESFNRELLIWDEIKRQFGDEIKSALAMYGSIGGASSLSKKITAWAASRPDLMSEIKSCYYKRYWITSCAYCFDAPIDIILMDSYFNMGINAKKIMQRWAGAKDDGIIGPQSRAAIRGCKKDPALLLKMRWEYYQTRPAFKKFGRGWKNRLIDLAKFCGIKADL